MEWKSFDSDIYNLNDTVYLLLVQQLIRSTMCNEFVYIFGRIFFGTSSVIEGKWHTYIYVK